MLNDFHSLAVPINLASNPMSKRVKARVNELQDGQLIT